jgi:hypothetical protein
MLSAVSKAKEISLIETAAITIERLRVFSDRTHTLVTVDAPLFGSIMILNGQMLGKGYDIEVGRSKGFPPPEQIIAEATRFWVLNGTGIRKRMSREEMAKLLDES